MKHSIDPTVDCVFKALLGSETNQNLLIHFLNAVLQSCTQSAVSSVEILNPYNEKEFPQAKLSIVDIKARDQSGHLYQVEIQLCGHPSLFKRILYTWADLYSKQIQSGEDYQKLQPTYSIWLLGYPLIPEDSAYLHRFQMLDKNSQTLLDPGAIFLLELNKFKITTVHSELERWLQFFKDGKTLDDQQLPLWMRTDEMRQAMTTLKRFSEKEKSYHLYQARQEYLRRERAIQQGVEEARATLEITQKKLGMTEQTLNTTQETLDTAQKELDMANKEKAVITEREQAATAEIEQLKALLAQQGKL